jgi:hypothetical protein
VVSDMIWLGKNIQDNKIDRLQGHFPGQILSYKVEVQGKEGHALDDARIVYFHGVPKPHEIPDEPWVKEHWR